jgi:hypothetical protein
LVARYAPSRRYFSLALFAAGGTMVSVWTSLRWAPAWAVTALFALSALGVFLLALRPVIEIHEAHLQIGHRLIPWGEILRLDQTRWNVPLVIDLTMADRSRLRLVYPGDSDSCLSLLRHLRQRSRKALLDGVPYRQFWGEPAPEKTVPPKQLPAPPRYPLLRPEDEQEVERLFRRLKSVGRLDPRGSDEK